MVMANSLDQTLQFHAEALSLRGLRQQVLASNIANADTPGYKARDIDFTKSLQDAVSGRVSANALTRTIGSDGAHAIVKGVGEVSMQQIKQIM